MTAVSEMMAPTDRSMPPEIITKVTPIAVIPTGVCCSTRFMR